MVLHVFYVFVVSGLTTSIFNNPVTIIGTVNNNSMKFCAKLEILQQGANSAVWLKIL